MPIHDWTLVDAGLFHHFHHQWVGSLCDALNGGVLPPDYFALAEQRIQGQIPDALTLELTAGAEESNHGKGGLAVASTPPRTRLVRRTEAAIYANKANRITLRHRHGNVVTVIEIVSPGNKASKGEFRAFIDKSVDLIRRGINLLVIDPFPPGKRDPQGIHKAIWDEFEEEELQLPADKPLTLASYDAGPEADRVAYVEFIAQGDALPAMPLFLKPEVYVPAPLEESYESAWKRFPVALKSLLE